MLAKKLSSLIPQFTNRSSKGNLKSKSQQLFKTKLKNVVTDSTFKSNLHNTFKLSSRKEEQ